jgi:uncharacterized protein (DUF1800 family)
MYILDGARPLRVGRLRRSLTALGIIVAFAMGAIAQAADTDGDSVQDHLDNCSAVGNTDQRDTDGDGFGNRCDTDLNNDRVTNGFDVVPFKAAIGSSGPHADFNGDGVVNGFDVIILQGYIGKAPGPGAVTITAAKAARFLAQTTFGPTTTEITNLQTLNDYNAWLDQQFAKPRSTFLPQARSMYVSYRDYCIATRPATECPSPIAEIVDTGNDYFRHQWWRNTVLGADQLRQRMALALSEILVISDKSPDLSDSTFGLSSYYDLLSTHAFGNYRVLLEEVTLHPVMGMYLSMLRNEKADPVRNIRPDENFARELQQLFTIGVHELRIDGTVVTDGVGDPVPTYDQSTIQAFARAFTGWNFANVGWYDYAGNGDRTLKMVPVAEFHDTDPKAVLSGVTLPGGQTPLQDLKAALDNVFNHPNVGPFLAKQLIKRFTTSNPSPAYVARVAGVFNNNGSGVRGDLKAVLRAILLDQEARDGVTARPTFGKLREPVLRVTQVFRAFNAQPIAGGDWDVAPSVSVFNSPYGSGLRRIDQDVGESALGSPSVFNFFRPDYSPAGPAGTAGLTGPEFQLWTENTVMALTNMLNFHVRYDDPSRDWTYLNLSAEQALAASSANLINHLDLLLTNGSMSAALRSTLTTHLADSSFPNDAAGRLEKVRDAITLVVNSPEYLVQK